MTPPPHRSPPTSRLQGPTVGPFTDGESPTGPEESRSVLIDARERLVRVLTRFFQPQDALGDLFKRLIRRHTCDSSILKTRQEFCLQPLPLSPGEHVLLRVGDLGLGEIQRQLASREVLARRGVPPLTTRDREAVGDSVLTHLDRANFIALVCHALMNCPDERQVLGFGDLPALVDQGRNVCRSLFAVRAPPQ